MAKTVPSADETLIASAKAGEYLFREGEAGREMFIIQSGALELWKKIGDADERMLTLTQGDFCGEFALLSGEPHAFSARAVSGLKALRIDGPTLLSLMRTEPEIALRLMRGLSRRAMVGMERWLEARLLTESQTRSVQQAPAAAAAPPSAPAAANPRPARLVHASGDEFPLPADHDALVGRADPTTGFAPDVVLSSLDAQRSLSRRHATLLRQGDSFQVREEPGVRNGTFVNGKRLKAGVPVKLKDGDEIAFGLIKTVLRLG
jgi:Cyclic nucleotide-binding domain/FHA domain